MTSIRNSFRIEIMAIRVSMYTVVANLALACMKMIIGIAASSDAMISDAFHSVSDIFSIFIVMIGVKMSSKTSDEEHSCVYKHLECVATILLAAVLGITGGAIGYHGILKIYALKNEEIPIPGVEALIVSAISILTKEIMYRYIRSVAKQIDSDVLMAEAWHHRTDALASIGSFIGIFGARMGIAAMDPAASVVICILIMKAALSILRGAIRKIAKG